MFRFLLLSLLLVQAWAAPLPPRSLRTGDMPHGATTLTVIDLSAPLTFTWTATHSQRGVRQEAARVVLRERNGAQVWDSGMVVSAQSSLLYTGPPLKPGADYIWEAKWRDTNGEESPFSVLPASFHTAPTDDVWKASSWIGSNVPLMRRSFSYTSTSHSKRTYLYVSGLGYFQLYLNGHHVNHAEKISAAWTTYNKRVMYFTYDVTHMLKEGENVVGVMLGNGWRDTSIFPVNWMPSSCDVNEMLLRLVMVDSKTSSIIVASDDKWSGTTSGPVVSASVYNGETYDARREQSGWSKSGFVLSADWAPVQVVAPSCFDPIMSALTIPRITEHGVHTPIGIRRQSDSSQIVDFGDNLTGWVRIFVKGEAGSNVTIKHAEVLQHPPYGPVNGELYYGNLRSAQATDIYVLKGDKAGEWYEPHFTYHGFRYAEVLYYPGDLDASNIRRIHFRTENPSTLSFHTSSPVLDRIQYASAKGQGSNMMSVPTDCNQRDERLGWMGDAGLSSETMSLNFDVESFHKHFLQIVVDNQDESTGSLPDVVPFVRYGNRPADPSWSAAFPQVVYVRYQMDGDLETAALRWDSLVAYMKSVKLQIDSVGGLAKWDSTYGDWVPADPNTKIGIPISSTMNYITNVKQLIELGNALGKLEDVAYFEDLLAWLTKEYAVAFLDPTTGCYGVCGQTSYSFAYLSGVIPDSDLPALAANLSSDIVEKYSSHISGGIIGVKTLFPALMDLGLNDIALSLVEQTSYPSWGFMFFNTIEASTSSIWELWDSAMQGPGMNSRNHHMFSSISAWLVQSVGGLVSATPAHACGINSEPMTLAPAMFLGVSSARTSIATKCGDIGLSYKREGGVQCVRVPQSTAPATADEAVIDCGVNGGKITEVMFASWGYPTGTCGNFEVNESCHASNAVDVVNTMCVGRRSCKISTRPTNWSTTGSCVANQEGDPLTLAVQVRCSGDHALAVTASVPLNARAELLLPLYGTEPSAAQLSETSAGRLLTRNGAVSNGITAATGVERVVVDGDKVVVQVGSGDFDFLLTSFREGEVAEPVMVAAIA